MNGINRLIIFFLLIALLYALYRYQQSSSASKSSINEEKLKTKTNVKSIKDKAENSKKNGKKGDASSRKDKNKNENENLIDEDTFDLDNISQLSLNSIDDDGSFKQDSVLNSLNSDTYSFLDDGSRESQADNFFS